MTTTVTLDCCTLFSTVHGFLRTAYNVVESTGMGDDGREGRLDTVFQLYVKGNGDPFPIAGMITAEEDGATGIICTS